MVGLHRFFPFFVILLLLCCSTVVHAQLDASDRASGKYSAESAKAAFQDGTAVIVRDHDKAGVFHSENVHPIDFDECTTIVPSDGELFGDYVFLLPTPKLYKLLSQSMDLLSEWPSLKDPIDTWFRDVPYVQSGSEDRVEKRIEVEYEAEGLYPSVVDENIYVMLKSDYGNSHNSSDAGVYLVRTLKVR